MIPVLFQYKTIINIYYRQVNDVRMKHKLTYNTDPCVNPI